jgi:hypothetical protein
MGSTLFLKEQIALNELLRKFFFQFPLKGLSLRMARRFILVDDGREHDSEKIPTTPETPKQSS